MKHLLWCILLVSGFIKVNSQNISGSWFGVGKPEGISSSNTYLTELVLVQKGKSLTGELSYYFRDSLFTNKITGVFDAASRIVKINPTTFIFHKSVSTVNGVDCPMFGEFILRIAKAESVLTGSFYAQNDYKFTCPTLNFKLKKHIDTDEEKDSSTHKEAINEDSNIVVKTDTIVKKEEPVKSSADTINTEIKKKKEEEFAKREKKYLREIIVTNSNLRLEFYDNGAIDYDSISVFLNNKLVLPKSKLDHKALKVNIQLDPNLPFSELSMFAESLGFIPPNTAALVIYDGEKRYDILMTSDFTTTSTIKLIRKKE